ncbi:hypothetical protein OIO90_006143 [Microbotryomycetes sp. JL221]|nr:hypothetical protein OIO90_006143 [Microbotryomycetes sp. JL221]
MSDDDLYYVEGPLPPLLASETEQPNIAVDDSTGLESPLPVTPMAVDSGQQLIGLQGQNISAAQNATIDDEVMLDGTVLVGESDGQRKLDELRKAAFAQMDGTETNKDIEKRLDRYMYVLKKKWLLSLKQKRNDARGAVQTAVGSAQTFKQAEDGKDVAPSPSATLEVTALAGGSGTATSKLNKQQTVPQPVSHPFVQEATGNGIGNSDSLSVTKNVATQTSIDVNVRTNRVMSSATKQKSVNESQTTAILFPGESYCFAVHPQNDSPLGQKCRRSNNKLLAGELLVVSTCTTRQGNKTKTSEYKRHVGCMKEREWIRIKQVYHEVKEIPGYSQLDRPNQGIARRQMMGLESSPAHVGLEASLAFKQHRKPLPEQTAPLWKKKSAVFDKLRQIVTTDRVRRSQAQLQGTNGDDK